MIDDENGITEEFVVTYYSIPSSHRYLPLYANMSEPDRDIFENEEEAWEFGLKKAEEGFFNVDVCAEVTTDGDIDFQDIGCPYIEQSLDEKLNVLLWQRDEVQGHLVEPQCLSHWDYVDSRELLQKLEHQIEQITTPIIKKAKVQS